MPSTILDSFDFLVPPQSLLEKCHADATDDEGIRILELYHQAYRIGRPKALVREVPVREINASTVRVGSVDIPSPFVREKLLQAPIAFPYVVTCGTEVESWSKSLDDVVDQFYVDELKKLWLGCAIQALHIYVQSQFPPDAHLSSLNPGSLTLWPIEGQKQLFQILHDVHDAIGVHLTESCLMLPAKSGSGILFLDHTNHVNCALCPRPQCPNRRAPQRLP